MSNSPDRRTPEASKPDPFRRVAIVIRSLARQPAYSLTLLLTLAIGLGASTSIFSILQGSVLEPLPYPDPDRLVRVRDLYVATGGSGGISVPNFHDLKREAGSLEGLAAYSHSSVNLATEEAPVRARGLAVTADFFTVLGLGPSLGRSFAAGEDREGADRVVVIRIVCGRSSSADDAVCSARRFA